MMAELDVLREELHADPRHSTEDGPGARVSGRAWGDYYGYPSR
jgi:hypothetical protein